ncbi:MAG: hypothetical protein V1662_04295 [Candidatus Omnitrophota bacterium]
MRLPRDISGIELAKMLERYEYCVTRQTGIKYNLKGNTAEWVLTDIENITEMRRSGPRGRWNIKSTA